MKFNLFEYDELVRDLLLSNLFGLTDEMISEKHKHRVPTVEDVAVAREELSKVIIKELDCAEDIDSEVV